MPVMRLTSLFKTQKPEEANKIIKIIDRLEAKLPVILKKDMMLKSDDKQLIKAAYAKIKIEDQFYDHLRYQPYTKPNHAINASLANTSPLFTIK